MKRDKVTISLTLLIIFLLVPIKKEDKETRIIIVISNSCLACLQLQNFLRYQRFEYELINYQELNYHFESATNLGKTLKDSLSFKSVPHMFLYGINIEREINGFELIVNYFSSMIEQMNNI